MKRKSPNAAMALAAIGQATGRGRGRRSPLSLWFRKHHDELAAGFARNAPAWQALAKFLGEQGVVDVDGKPPTARGARDAWWRVRRDIKAAAEMSPAAPIPSKPGKVPAGVRAMSRPPPLPATRADSPLASELQRMADTRPRMPPLKTRKTT